MVRTAAGWRLIWARAPQAQAYPDRLIKVIVPFVPGSPVDAAARVITQQMLGGRIDINMAPTANLLALIQDGKGGRSPSPVRSAARISPTCRP